MVEWVGGWSVRYGWIGGRRERVKPKVLKRLERSSIKTSALVFKGGVRV
jgi:hypothetical protein